MTSSLSLLLRPLVALEAWFARRTRALSGPRAPMLAAVLVPLLFGLMSLMLGQDDGWDMKNYHLYNPHALLNGRMGVDIAPGQWQSYFNPTLDLPYYLMTAWFPGPVTGFVFGVLHGLNFVLLFAIARCVLGADQGGGYRVPLLLGIAGACSAGFLSELGNSMGDNMTALLVLGALLILLRRWDQLQQWSRAAVLAALGAGFVMGLGTGLKLTNATYALALCAAFAVAPGTLWLRFRLAFLFGVATLAGIAVTAGWWLLKMWQAFGNPLFPQFNGIFRSPLAQQVAVMDAFHLPKNALEALFWPIVFTFDFLRVSEVALRQTIWPIVYLLFIGVCAYLLFVRVTKRRDGKPALAPRACFVLVFFALGYLGWMKLFSIHRYLIPIEMLAPLVVWVLLQRVLAPGAARRVGGWVLAFTTLAVFPFVTWGHAPWASKSFSAELPPFAQPASTIVFTAHVHPPMGWMATLMPKEVSVVSLVGFPSTPAHVDRINAVIASRPGPHYAMLYANKNYKQDSVPRKLKLAQMLGLTESEAGCAKLDRILKRVRFQVQMQPLAGAPGGQHCALELQPKYRMDLPALDRAVVAEAQKTLQGYGLALDGTACKIYPAHIGADPYPYQLCPVMVVPR
ncbi:glycosyltransferase 87 family protein [Massilia sp. Root418]|jgi:hypothetical protein|uniref:glycosyltransferase 87 family protein n=1 Tax=Massilia sp. Root418 TaxID=1736532 RepID=UPI000A86BC02|nr:glycosyltransferase 87 family protein [Massilia sp. Root418]